MRVELREQVAHVVADGRVSEVESVSDLDRRAACRKQFEHLELPRRELWGTRAVVPGHWRARFPRKDQDGDDPPVLGKRQMLPACVPLVAVAIDERRSEIGRLDVLDCPLEVCT